MNRKIAFLFAAPLFALVWMLFKPMPSQASFSYVTDTLSTSRLSVAGKTASVVGNTVTMATTASAGFYSTSSANLRVGDLVDVGTGTGITITGIASYSATGASVFTASGTPAAGNIYYKSRPQHQISFQPNSSVTGGFFRVLIPAGAGTNNDGAPDSDGFDFDSFNATYATASGLGTGYFDAATASGGTNCTAGYHCFEFHFPGTVSSATPVYLYIGNASTTANTGLIAPAPSSTHSLGLADTYPIIVQEFANGANPTTAAPVDTAKSKVALVESVRVFAVVEPSISFQIVGVANGVSACGSTTTVSTQSPGVEAPLTVPFGSLALNTLFNAAHTLVVNTNAVNGYIVTAVEDHALGLNGGSATVIADTSVAAYTSTTGAAWASGSTNGFGHSSQSANGASVYPTSGNYRAFANALSLQPPQTVMYGTTFANDHRAYVCYRVSVGATQPAGDYENQVTYTATASF